MMYNIDKVPLEDIAAFLKRLVRIYVILVVISIVRMMTGDLDFAIELILNIIGLGLYVVDAVMIKIVSENPTIYYSVFPLVSSITLCIFNMIETTILVVMDNNLFSLFNLISVFVQLTTIYILYKLREKIHAQDNAIVHNDIEALEVPMKEMVVSPIMTNEPQLDVSNGNK